MSSADPPPHWADAMDSPPPDQSQGVRWNPWGLMLTFGLFGASLLTSCVQREKHGEELKKQGKDLQEIKAMMQEQRKRSE